jgi:hypothetical protein
MTAKENKQMYYTEDNASYPSWQEREAHELGASAAEVTDWTSGRSDWYDQKIWEYIESLEDEARIWAAYLAGFRRARAGH